MGKVDYNTISIVIKMTSTCNDKHLPKYNAFDFSFL